MRGQMDAMRRVYAESEGSFVLQSHELERRREAAVGQGATRAAHLEDQCDRHRRMLQAWPDTASPDALLVVHIYATAAAAVALLVASMGTSVGPT